MYLKMNNEIKMKSFGGWKQPLKQSIYGINNSIRNDYESF